MQLIVKTDFRHNGISYPVGKKPVDLPEDVAALALKEGWAVDMKKVKALGGAPDDKALTGSTENKALQNAPENKQQTLIGALPGTEAGQQNQDPATA